MAEIIGTVADAVHAAMNGPEGHLSIYEHGFIVKPASSVRRGKKLVVNGQISHVWKNLNDDQLYYGFSVAEKVVMDITKNISFGGADQFISPLVSAVSAYFGVPIPPDKVGEVARAVSKITDGDWQTVADAIIASIALGFQEREISGELGGSDPQVVRWPAGIAEGDVAKTPSSPKCYLIENRTKRWIPDEATYLSRWTWDILKIIPEEALDAIPSGPDLPTVLVAVGVPDPT